MDDAKRLFNRLIAGGFQLEADGDTLKVSGPKLTDELRAEIRLHESWLLQHVERRAERVAIQQEAMASPGDLDWPTFADVQARKLPPGWAITEWRPAAQAISYADELAAAGVEVHRVAGNCPCGSDGSILVPIHDGESLRQDCAKCGRFQEFPVWGDAGEVDRMLAVLSNRRDAPEAATSKASLTHPLGLESKRTS